MKIILTHAYFIEEDQKEQEINRPYPPLGLLYLSAFVKQHTSFDVRVLDSTFINVLNWKDELLRSKPDIIAFYANIMTKIRLVQLVRELKLQLPDTIFVIGGPDVGYNAENYLRAGFDVAVIGEGEETLLELCQAVESGGDTSVIPGLAFLSENNLIQTPERIKIRDMEEIPTPDRNAIDFEKYLSYWSKHHGSRTASISTQRGCPYTCKWCSTAVYGQSYRRNSAKRVVDEIRFLKDEYQVDALWFVDDVFTVSHKWIKDLYNEFKLSQLVIPFECITRAERLNEEVLTMLKEMGCFRIWIGAESGSQRIIDKMDRRVDVSVVREMIRKTKQHGIEAGTFIMVGYPDEKQDDLVLTMEHLKESIPDLLTITRAYPIKGTDLYDEVKDELPDYNWTTISDRELKFKVPYKDQYYKYAIAYLANGWLYHKDKGIMSFLKYKVAGALMALYRK